jgi:hypothetical protein
MERGALSVLAGVASAMWTVWSVIVSANRRQNSSGLVTGKLPFRIEKQAYIIIKK